jgi:hypothetical protein
LFAVATIEMLDRIGVEMMDHSEALQQMAAERYLLDELTPDAREAFEEHLFDCPECALDLRAGAAFVEVAKTQLPELTGAMPVPVPSRSHEHKVKREWRLFLFRPAFAAPAFATLLMVIGYQNLVTYPRLRAAASQPRLIPWAQLHEAMRGGAPVPITADRVHGVALPIDLPSQLSEGAYASYSIDLYDPRGKLAFSSIVAAPGESDSGPQRLGLVIPGAALHNGVYTLALSGVAANGERTVIDRYAFELHLD